MTQVLHHNLWFYLMQLHAHRFLVQWGITEVPHKFTSWSTSNICGTLMQYLTDLLTTLTRWQHTELADCRSDTKACVWRTSGCVVFSPQSCWDVWPICSLWTAAVSPFMWLHQSSQLSPEPWPLSQRREGLCLPAWTRGMICWSSSRRAFARSDGYFWMRSAQDGPVASCLGLNGAAWPSVALLPRDSLLTLCRHSVVSSKWRVSHSVLEQQNCCLLFTAKWRHSHRYKAHNTVKVTDPGSV